MPSLKHLNALDYLVILCYLVIVASVGLALARYNRQTDDYFKAGGKLPWFMSSLSMFVSGFSAFMFVSAAGYTYRNGLSSAVVFTSAFWAYWLGFFVYGRLWRRARLKSPMEFLTRRYSQSTTYFYTLLSVIPNVLILGAMIYTLCIFISSALGLGKLTLAIGPLAFTGFELTLITIGVVLMVYTVFGGLWAVVVTDTLQFLILLLMTLVIFPLSFLYLGDGSFSAGFSRLVDEAPTGFLDFTKGNQTLFFLIAYLINTMMGYNVNWHIGQRYYSIAEERDTKKLASVCAWFSLIAPLLWIAPVLVSRIVFPDMQSLWPELAEPTEASFASLCLLMLPHGLLGVVVSAMLAASMSSADTAFNWLAAVVTKDLFVPVVERFKSGRTPSDRVQLIVGKMTVLALGLLAIVISLSMQNYGGSFDIYLKIYSIFTPSMFVPVMLGLIFRKTPWWSAIAATVTGIIAVVIAGSAANLVTGLPLSGVGDLFLDVHVAPFGFAMGRYEINSLVGVFVSAAVFVVSAKWSNTRQADIERLAAFDRDLRTPAHAVGEAFDLKGLQAYKMVGVLSIFVGIVLALLALAADTTTGVLVNVLTGLGAIVFGLLFWLVAGHWQKKLPPSLPENLHSAAGNLG